MNHFNLKILCVGMPPLLFYVAFFYWLNINYQPTHLINGLLTLLITAQYFFTLGWSYVEPSR